MTEQRLVQTLLESNMLWIFPGAPVKALKRVAHVLKCERAKEKHEAEKNNICFSSLPFFYWNEGYLPWLEV